MKNNLKFLFIVLVQTFFFARILSFIYPSSRRLGYVSRLTFSSGSLPSTDENLSKKKVVIIGAGWGGLSTAYALAKTQKFNVTVVEASSRVGGVVRDGYSSKDGLIRAEAGQHGFWNNYLNIYRLFDELELGDTILSDFSEQGQYSPRGLEAIWPVYKDQSLKLPTGIAQLVYTRFMELPLFDRLTALPMVLAFSDFDDSVEAWKRYDETSFKDLCMKLGVSKRCYDEAFEPMILTGLFAPGSECSAAAAMGMAYFFVLQSQTAFDVQWCRGNIGETIFQPWVQLMKNKYDVTFECSTRFTGVDIDENDTIKRLFCTRVSSESIDDTKLVLETDYVVFAVGSKALSNFVQFSPELASYKEFRRFSNLRGTSVLATRLFLDKNITIPYTANACWGFDEGIGMTFFDIKSLHGIEASTVQNAPGSVIEVDYYYANKLLVMSHDLLLKKVKRDLDIILGKECQKTKVIDAAIVRLPQAVNWYFPGSYKDMPDTSSSSVTNLFFAGDIVRSRSGVWSQEKAFVTGMEAANKILGNSIEKDILPLPSDELHVKLGKNLVAFARKLVS